MRYYDYRKNYKMKILVGCEYSGRVRDAFIARGHEAVSCDLRPSESDAGRHIQGDILEVLQYDIESWDALIAHPYCTFNCLSGVRWLYHPEDTHLPAALRRRHPLYPDRMEQFERGAEFFNALKNCDIPKKVLENSQPHGLAMSRIGRYDQIVQPWMFGDPYTKAAALWIIGLPKLIPTHTKSDYDAIYDACHKMPPGPNREKERSRTHPSIAKAFAEQWG